MGARPAAASRPQLQAQQTAPTVASVLDGEISAVEKEIVGAAEAMPEDKYNFSPESLKIPGSEYKGVRTFAGQVKHVAIANYFIWAPITGEPRTVELISICGNLVDVPEVDGVVEFDADLFAAFGIAATVDDLGGGAGAFVFAAEDNRAAFFYRAAAEEGGAVTAGGDGPGFFVPGLVRVFATQPDGDGAGGARAAADFLG